MLTSLENRILPAALLTILIAFWIGEAGAEWKGKEEMKDGVLHVVNPSQPSQGVVTVDLAEQWRIGGNSDDENEFFGVISQCVENGEGEIFLLDTQLSEIRVFTREGEYIRTIGREGEGPGEFRNASDMYIGLGGKVGVVQVWPGKIVQMTQFGEPLDDFRLPEVEGGGFQLVFVTRATADRLVVAGSRQARAEGKMMETKYLKAFDAAGEELAQYHSTSNETRYGGMKFEEEKFADYQRRWALAGDGRVAAAIDFGAYAIHVWNPNGTLQRIIHREYESLRRSSAELARFQKMYDGFTRWNPNSTFEISDIHMDVNQIFFRDDGSMWVMTSREIYDRAEGIMAEFDVFDRDGRFVREVRMKGEGNPEEDGFFFVGDRLYIVTSQLTALMAQLGISGEEDDYGEEAEPVSVICYQLDEAVIGMK